MDRPHFTKQNHEFQDARGDISKHRQLRFNNGYGLSSQQSSWRNGDIRIAEIMMEVEMKIRGLLMDPVTNMPIVILKDVTSDMVLPIWVGIYEANAIALEIEKVTTPRPMTHDLIKNVLVGLDTQVHKVVVTELREDTFYAVIFMEREGRIVSIDSRPSDALALALRVDCPIYVEDEVLKNSKLAANVSDRVSSEELRKWLEGLNDEDLGRYKM
jgi:bifunctional DNase/RNase